MSPAVYTSQTILFTVRIRHLEFPFVAVMPDRYQRQVLAGRYRDRFQFPRASNSTGIAWPKGRPIAAGSGDRNLPLSRSEAGAPTCLGVTWVMSPSARRGRINRWGDVIVLSSGFSR